MACPYFIPLRILDWSTGRSPLGAIYEGECDLGGKAEARYCNFGYARGHCQEFPETEPADAVRFSMSGSKIIWILEKDHAPLEHGDLEFTDPTSVLAAQAKVFLKNQPPRRPK